MLKAAFLLHDESMFDKSQVTSFILCENLTYLNIFTIMSFWLILVLLLFFWPIWTLLGLFKQYRVARSLGVPAVISPIDESNLLWLLLGSRVIPLLRLLPPSLNGFTHYLGRGWIWTDKGQSHIQLGDVLAKVTPSSCKIIVADPRACDDILNRRKDFFKAPYTRKAFSVFGENVHIAEGETWQRHRKITVPPFNERNNRLVWDETGVRAKDMLQKWLGAGIAGTHDTMPDTHSLALHVLCAAGFGRSYAFGSSALNQPAPGHQLSHFDAIQIVLDNLFSTVLLGILRIPSKLLIGRLKLANTAVIEFKQYMMEMVRQERQSYTEDQYLAHPNLMSTLVRASEEAQHEKADSSVVPKGLDQDEMLGNLFLYNVAGYATTGMTQTFSLGELTSQPRWQQWLGEEIDGVLGHSNGAGTTIDYETTFPRLPRCLAVMYETLRVYPVVIGLDRWTNSQLQTLHLGNNKTLSLPPDTIVTINNPALHFRTDYWGPDALAWRPDRWIHHSEETGQETFLEPNHDAPYLPWSKGPRVCPGRKFAQVEFVAILLRLFHANRVLPVLEPGETDLAQARSRIKGLLEDAHADPGLMPRHPEKMRLRWVGKKEFEGLI